MKRFIAVLALFAALQGVSSAQQKGFQGFVSVGRNDAVTAGEIDNDVLTLKTFDLIGGYRFLPNQFVGAGVELQFSELSALELLVVAIGVGALRKLIEFVV